MPSNTPNATQPCFPYTRAANRMQLNNPDYAIIYAASFNVCFQCPRSLPKFQKPELP